jgi:hypothetical protein
MDVGNPSLTKFAIRLVDCSYYGRVWRTVDHFAIEQSHQAFQVFDLAGRNSVEVAVPSKVVAIVPITAETKAIPMPTLSATALKQQSRMPSFLNKPE